MPQQCRVPSQVIPARQACLEAAGSPEAWRERDWAGACWRRPGLEPGFRNDVNFKNSLNSLKSLNSLNFESPGFINFKSPGVLNSLNSLKFKSPGRF